MAFSWHLLFILAAFICFVLAAFSVPSPPRINLTAAGLALLTAGSSSLSGSGAAHEAQVSADADHNEE